MNIVVLAAGMGKRMQSRLPKVLHPIAGQPMLARIVATVRRLPGAHIIVVIGHQGDQVRAALADASLHWAVQEPQLGTGHAVQQAVPLLSSAADEPGDRTLILYGDVPLTRLETLQSLSAASGEGSARRLVVLTVTLADPTGYGRSSAVRTVASSKPSSKRRTPRPSNERFAR